MSDGPYARLYLSLIDDEKFETIYDNDHHFAAWCRLLMIAEAAWPASGHLPRSTRRASIRALTDAGLIDILPSSGPTSTVSTDPIGAPVQVQPSMRRC